MAAQGGGDIRDAVLAQQVEGGVATGGEIGRSMVHSDLAGIFTQRHVADIVQAALDLPVPAP